MLGKLPYYICSLIKQKVASSYCLRSQDIVLLDVPRVRTVLGKTAFMCAAPLAWNSLQAKLKLSIFISLNVFKACLNEMLSDTLGICKC